MFNADNPWDEDGQKQSGVALATIFTARNSLTASAKDFPNISRQITKLVDDLIVIEADYRQDISSYRQSRSLTAVHLPAIVSSLTLLKELRENGSNDDRIAEIEAGITSCFRAASDVRARIDESKISRLEIDVTALDKTIKTSPSDRTAQAAPSPFGTPLKIGKNMANGVAIFGKRTIAPITEGVSRHTKAGYTKTTSYTSAFLEDGIEMATAPLATRVSALKEVAACVSVTAIFGGLFIAAIFPPAAPLAIGLAALEAPDIYADTLTKATKRRTEAHKQRRADRDSDVANTLAQIRSSSDVIRIETPCLHITMDMKNGTADGIVLAGRHIGQMLSTLPHEQIALMQSKATDTETAQALCSWMNRQNRII
jgi:hypothetical protein